MLFSRRLRFLPLTLKKLVFIVSEKWSMPSRSELPGELSRKKFLNTLRRLGFEINTVGGKGDHIKIIWRATQKSVTITGELRKDVLYYLLKEIESVSGVTWEKIKTEL